MTWRSSEIEETVLKRIADSANEETFDHVNLRIRARNFDSDGIIKAATFRNELCVALEVEPRGPPLSSIELLRQGNSSGLSITLGLGIWSTLKLEYVTHVTLNDGIASLWDQSVLSRFNSLKTLDLSHSAIGTLPSVIGLLSFLVELKVDGNKLQTVPPELGRLSNLQILSLNSNNISILPGELSRCTALRGLFLESNQLSRVSINFRSLIQLQSLHLLGNPLESLPDIVACAKLRDLSVANLRIEANDDYSTFKVDVVTLPGSGSAIKISLFDTNQNEKLSSLGLILRSSSSHHPLVAGALCRFFYCCKIQFDNIFYDTDESTHFVSPPYRSSGRYRSQVCDSGRHPGQRSAAVDLHGP